MYGHWLKKERCWKRRFGTMGVLGFNKNIDSIKHFQGFQDHWDLAP
jgi:hypothetical protein